eukprot:593331-Pelagomonas_calceolata.AAC.2
MACTHSAVDAVGTAGAAGAVVAIEDLHAQCSGFSGCTWSCRGREAVDAEGDDLHALMGKC